jgi:hypothetical protein
MLRRSTGFLAVMAVIAPLKAGAAENKYHVTVAEQNACGADAISLCGDSGKDEDSLLACMKANRASLSPSCSPVFNEGLRRRGLR